MRQTAIREKTYRADIDGLRAVAVLSVIVFHFNKLWLPGGFVGVDIFFVISGYLITGILAKKIMSGSFSFVEFYGSRMRRIFPAAFVCVSCPDCWLEFYASIRLLVISTVRSGICCFGGKYLFLVEFGYQLFCFILGTCAASTHVVAWCGGAILFAMAYTFVFYFSACQIAVVCLYCVCFDFVKFLGRRKVLNIRSVIFLLYVAV